jgi:hypothetical protein
MGQWRDVSFSGGKREVYLYRNGERAHGHAMERYTPPARAFAFDARPIVPGACRAGMLVKKSARRARNVPTTPPTGTPLLSRLHMFDTQTRLRPEPQTLHRVACVTQTLAEITVAGAR